MAQAPKSHRLPRFPASSKAQYRRAKPKEKRGNSHQRGYGRRWREFREAFLRSHPLCEYCSTPDRPVIATVVDHDEPHHGDSEVFWSTTFTALCKSCHDGPKAWAEARMSGDDLLEWVRKRKAGGQRE